MKLTDANRPLRVLEKAMKGGLGPGNIGVIISRRGTGKHAVLTSIAIDHAMDGRNTLHVALNESVSDVRAYDDEVFREIATSLGIPNRSEVLAEVERHKQIYTYKGGVFSVKKLGEILRFLTERAEFETEMVELRGWPDFERVDPEEFRRLKELAVEHRCEIWCTAHTHREDPRDERGLPAYVSRHLELIEVLISLEPEERTTRLRILKAHDAAPPAGVQLSFDPATMLIRWQ